MSPSFACVRASGESLYPSLFKRRDFVSVLIQGSKNEARLLWEVV